MDGRERREAEEELEVHMLYKLDESEFQNFIEGLGKVSMDLSARNGMKLSYCWSAKCRECPFFSEEGLANAYISKQNWKKLKNFWTEESKESVDRIPQLLSKGSATTCIENLPALYMLSCPDLPDLRWNSERVCLCSLSIGRTIKK